MHGWQLYREVYNVTYVCVHNLFTNTLSFSECDENKENVISVTSLVYKNTNNCFIGNSVEVVTGAVRNGHERALIIYVNSCSLTCTDIRPTTWIR